MEKPHHIPFQTMDGSLVSGLFVKQIGGDSHGAMKRMPHRDDYYMLAFITGGHAELSIDFNNLEISAGKAVIISPSQVHSPSGATNDVCGWLMGISSEHFTPHEVELTAKYALNPTPIRLPDSVVDDIDSLFKMLTRYSDNYQVAKTLAMAIKSLVIFYVDIGVASICDRYMVIALGLKNLLATKLVEVKSPSAYAAMMNISELYLNEAVKAVTGLNVSTFIRCQIILTAKRQLAYTSLSAKQVAIALGYDDYAYFSKIFKKETGLSPTQYRKNLK